MNLSQVVLSHRRAEELLPEQAQEWMMRLPKFYATTAPKQVSQTYQQALKGKRLILKGNQSTGWQFDKDKSALRFKERSASKERLPAFKTWVYGIATDQFLLVEAKNEEGPPGCPPHVWSYKVESLTDTTVSLREIVLGWDTVDESIQFYDIKP
jgi:hypothetical protein